MIVRPDGAWLWLVRQPDHAALAADVMAAWRAEGLPGRATREAVLFATAEHDVGWTEIDAAPLVDLASGRPLDFVSVPPDVKQRVWQRAQEVLPARSTYAAALVAQHALTIFRRLRRDAAWAPFFAAMEGARDRWFTCDVRPDGTTGGPVDPPVAARVTFLQDYATLGMGDLLSLTFCNGWTDPQSGEGYTIALRGPLLVVSPDPFEGRRVPLRVRARRIAGRPYASNADLQDALRAAADDCLEGVAVGAEEPPGA
jgi:hypothetical protein